MLDVLAAWGPNPGHPADVDGDDIVGILDFLELPPARIRSLRDPSTR